MKNDFGSIDILVHSLANGPEVRLVLNVETLMHNLFCTKQAEQSPSLQVTKPLLETSRKGYLAAISASSYSYISLLKYFLPITNPGTFLHLFIEIALSILFVLESPLMRYEKHICTFWLQAVLQFLFPILLQKGSFLGIFSIHVNFVIIIKL